MEEVSERRYVVWDQGNGTYGSQVPGGTNLRAISGVLSETGLKTLAREHEVIILVATDEGIRIETME